MMRDSLELLKWLVGSYVYNAYGQIVSKSGAMADINPLRYRGYYYDTETGFYYLNSRYYDAQIGRFINADGYVSTGQDINGNNMFAYCGNNPVNRIDPTGHFWQELWEAFEQSVQQASGVFAAAGVITQLDSPIPGPADVVGGVLALGTVLVCGGIAIYNVAKTSSKANEKGKDITIAPPPKDTVIYRYGYSKEGIDKLVPTTADVATNTGLSFSTVPKPGAAMTTINTLNATGVLRAVQDGATHVSVYPVGGTVADWHNAGSNSIWTQTLNIVCIKWDGGN